MLDKLLLQLKKTVYNLSTYQAEQAVNSNVKQV